MASVHGVTLTGFELSRKGIGEMLCSDELAACLSAKGEAIAEAMTAEDPTGDGRAVFASYDTVKGRARTFVTASSQAAKSYARKHPEIFIRNMGAAG